MGTVLLRGFVAPDGFGNASRTWPIRDIRRTVAANFDDLHVGTLNVDLDEEPPPFRPDFTLDAKDRSDGGAESFGFQRCRLRMQAGTVEALIARTSTNFHGDWTLEIMATEHLRSRYGLKETDPVTVEIW